MKVLLHISYLAEHFRNTDLRYLSLFLSSQEFFPDIVFEHSPSLLSAMLEFTYLLSQRLLSRLGVNLSTNPLIYSLSLQNLFLYKLSYLRACDVILTHGPLPLNRGRKLPPIVWETGALGKDHLKAQYGDDANKIWQTEMDVKRKLGQRAAKIGIAYPAAAERFKSYAPELASKVCVLPCFIPHAQTMPWEEIRNKHDNCNPINIAFVGNQAKRKSLDLVYVSLSRLPKEVQENVNLYVVSKFLDGDIPVPKDLFCKTHFFADLPISEVQEILKIAHIYFMPSRVESYGITYVEAMAKGCLVIAPNKEPQDYLLDYGKAGLLVNPNDIDEITNCISKALSDKELRLSLVSNATDRVDSLLGPKPVALAYANTFKEILNK